MPSFLLLSSSLGSTTNIRRASSFDSSSSNSGGEDFRLRASSDCCLQLRCDLQICSSSSVNLEKERSWDWAEAGIYKARRAEAMHEALSSICSKIIWLAKEGILAFTSLPPYSAVSAILPPIIVIGATMVKTTDGREKMWDSDVIQKSNEESDHDDNPSTTAASSSSKLAIVPFLLSSFPRIYDKTLRRASSFDSSSSKQRREDFRLRGFFATAVCQLPTKAWSLRKAQPFTRSHLTPSFRYLPPLHMKKNTQSPEERGKLGYSTKSSDLTSAFPPPPPPHGRSLHRIRSKARRPDLISREASWHSLLCLPILLSVAILPPIIFIGATMRENNRTHFRMATMVGKASTGQQ
nr:putative phospholipid-transporting ATPase 9 [Ipomoea batatas]